MNEIRVPDCFYRVSVKALVLDETRTKFLITKEDNGFWELPGGGLDWGMDPYGELRREVREEMGLEATWIADKPSYFLSGRSNPTRSGKRFWAANIVYEAKLEHLKFTPSEECVEIMFADKNDIARLETFSNVQKLAEMFDPKNHQHKNS